MTERVLEVEKHRELRLSPDRVTARLPPRDRFRGDVQQGGQFGLTQAPMALRAKRSSSPLMPSAC
jgi:hypothetical protein